MPYLNLQIRLISYLESEFVKFIILSKAEDLANRVKKSYQEWLFDQPFYDGRENGNLTVSEVNIDSL